MWFNIQKHNEIIGTNSIHNIGGDNFTIQINKYMTIYKSTLSFYKGPNISTLLQALSFSNIYLEGWHEYIWIGFSL